MHFGDRFGLYKMDCKYKVTFRETSKKMKSLIQKGFNPNSCFVVHLYLWWIYEGAPHMCSIYLNLQRQQCTPVTAPELCGIEERHNVFLRGQKSQNLPKMTIFVISPPLLTGRSKAFNWGNALMLPPTHWCRHWFLPSTLKSWIRPLAIVLFSLQFSFNDI